MTQNESELKLSIRKRLIAPECNALVYAFAGSVFSIRGIPDWYVSHRIWRGWLELKDKDNPYSPHQKTEIIRLNSRGDHAFGLRRKQDHLLLEAVDPSGKIICLGTCTNYRAPGIELLTWISHAGR